MGEVIECSKCYHLQQTAPDAGYCGHMHVNPCYRGMHREPKVTPVPLEILPPLPPRHHMSNSEKGCLAARERKVKAVAPLDSGKYKHLIKPPDGSEAADKMFRSHDLTAESPHPKAGSLKSKTVKRAAPPPEVPEYKEYGNRTKKAKYDYKAHHHKIFEMLIAGYSYRAIAARVGIPAQHIWKYCTKYLKNKEDKNV